MLLLSCFVRKSLGLLKLSTSPVCLFLIILIQSSTTQFKTHAPQYMQSSSINPISPAFQNNALVGHAFMHSLHSTPLHVLLLMVMLPSAKNSSMPKGARSSSLRFLFSVSKRLSKLRRSVSISDDFSLLLGIHFIFDPKYRQSICGFYEL